MFEIAFNEIFMIMVIALIVVGPERLPGMARKAGALLGKMRRFVSNVKQDIEKEVKAEELKKIIQEQADSAGIHEIIEETRQTLQKAESDYYVDKADEADASLVNETLAKQDASQDAATAEPVPTGADAAARKSDSSDSNT